MQFRNVLFVLLASITCTGAQAEKVYDIIPYERIQDFSLGAGVVTTDGTIGPIADANILDYTISFTTIHGSLTFTPENSDFLISESNPAIATNSELIVPPFDARGREAYAYIRGKGFPERRYVEFVGSSQDEPARVHISWWPSLHERTPVNFGEPLTFATARVVPEPTSLCFVPSILGAASLFRRRKRTS